MLIQPQVAQVHIQVRVSMSMLCILRKCDAWSDDCWEGKNCATQLQELYSLICVNSSKFTMMNANLSVSLPVRTSTPGAHGDTWCVDVRVTN